MLGFPLALKVYLTIEPVEMRKQFNGLWTLAEDRMKADPRQGRCLSSPTKPAPGSKCFTGTALACGF